MAHALGDFLRLIISKELLFQRTYFDCIPGKFAALESNDDEQRQQALEFCRRSFGAVEELEELVYTDRHERELHSALLWPLAIWPREVLLALCECDFDGVPGSADAGMYKELTECFRGWRSSWSIELLFNEARRVSSENLARRLSYLAMWHRAANSYIVEDFGRAPLVVQPEDEAETRGPCQRRCSTVRRMISFSAGEKFLRAVSVGQTFLAQPETRRHNGHSAASKSLDVLCERVRQVADSISEPRGATRHRASRS